MQWFMKVKYSHYLEEVHDPDPALLASCFSRCLAVAAEIGARSIAFGVV